MLGMSVPSSGMPSKTQRGSCDPFSEAVPRILIFTGAPGAPDEVTADKPAICPDKAWSMLFTAPTFSVDMSTLVTAAVSFRLSIF